ncbi:PfkB family carbohydrate kinase, partial [Myxococcota bacterium]|nr:PfkB family carbohydrate kinase [Myxococcota bacterium]
LDYRPVLWRLTGHGAGEERFLASDRVTEHLLSVVEGCDLVVGTEEEIHIAGGSTDTLAALRAIRARTAATIVMKRGPLGCVVFEGVIPATIDEGFVGRGVEVDVLNVLGAGDAFLAGFLRGWITGESLETSTRWANACGALVVSRHGCAPAMPTKLELDDWLRRAGEARHVARIDLDVRVAELHRVTTRRGEWPELCVLAFDHRVGLERLADRVGAPHARLHALKQHLVDAARLGAHRAGLEHGGMIIDDRWGREALERATATGWWLARPIERPSERPLDVETVTMDLLPRTGVVGSPLLELEGSPTFAMALRTWPVGQVVKCLVFYHPDHPEPIRRAQEERLEKLFQVVAHLGRELLLEVVPIRGNTADATVLPRALEALYRRGVRPDWWKLPPPEDAATWRALTAVIEQNDPFCRGVLLLGLDQPEEVLGQGFQLARDFAICRGFAVGRTIFGRAAEEWLQARQGPDADRALVEATAERFERMISLWRTRHG